MEVDQMRELIELDYTIIQSREELEDVIGRMKRVIENTIEGIHVLSNEKSRMECQRKMIISKMEEHMLENTHKVLQLQHLISEATQEHSKVQKQSEEEKDKTRKNIEQTYQNEMADHLRKLGQLEQQYKPLKELQDTETAYQKEIEGLKASIVTQQYVHHDNMNLQEQLQLRENSVLYNQHVDTLNQTKKHAYTVARDIVLQETTANQHQNITLKNKLIQLQIELAKLKKQRNEIHTKIKENKMNICLNQEELEEYKAVGSVQKAKIKAGQDKIDIISAQMAEEIKKRTAKIAGRKKERGNMVNELKVKLLQQQKKKQEMKANLQKMKILGDTILTQRNEIERFFIMALENCKKDIEGKPEGGAKVYGTKVDIEELTPKDKLRILTNLYTKLALGP